MGGRLTKFSDDRFGKENGHINGLGFRKISIGWSVD